MLEAFIPDARTPEWDGHWQVIPGTTSRYTIKSDADHGWTICVCQEYKTGNLGRELCRIVAGAQEKALVRAINRIKVRESGREGGKFLINEFRQVIVPNSSNRSRHLVGTIRGALEFRGEARGRFSLRADGHDPGDPWLGPYVGSVFHLSLNRGIYRETVQADGETVKEFLPARNRQLEYALSKLRPNAGCRFIVNDQGVVLVKVERSPRQWEPVYVDSLDYAKWWPSARVGQTQEVRR